MSSFRKGLLKEAWIVRLANRSLLSERADTIFLKCLKEMGSSRSSVVSSKSLQCLAWTGFSSLVSVFT